MSPVFIMTDSILLITEDIEGARISGGLFCHPLYSGGLIFTLCLHSSKVSYWIYVRQHNWPSHSFQDFFRLQKLSLILCCCHARIFCYSGGLWESPCQPVFLYICIFDIPSKVFIFVSILFTFSKV